MGSIKHYHMRQMIATWWSHSCGGSSLFCYSKYLFIWLERLQFLFSNSRMNFPTPRQDDVDHIAWDYMTQLEHSNRGKKGFKEVEMALCQ